MTFASAAAITLEPTAVNAFSESWSTHFGALVAGNADAFPVLSPAAIMINGGVLSVGEAPISATRIKVVESGLLASIATRPAGWTIIETFRWHADHNLAHTVSIPSATNWSITWLDGYQQDITDETAQRTSATSRN